MAELQGFGLSNVELESLKTILSVRFRSPQLEALSPEQQKLVIFVSLRKIIMGLARQKTIIVFEDLHFADELSLEAIDMILALGPIPNCILIKTYRPHFSYAWKNKDPQEVVIDLPPFTEDTLAAYMKTFTYNIPLSKKVLARIYTQSMGNPLFAGELMKSFLDTKKVHIVNNEYAFAGESSNLVIPDTLYSLLASRVDSLDSKTKATLKEASIIGQEFSFDELKSLSHLDGVALKHALNELLASGIIRDYRKAGQHIYEIIHALMREVVYKSMPHRERSKLHTIIADYLYEKHTNALDEYTQELAYHYKRSTKEDKAFQFLLRAGDETYKSSLISQANLYYIEAIACLTNNENIVSNKNIILIELNYKVGITNQLLGKIDISQKALSRALKFSHDHGINEFIPKIYHQIARVNKIKGDYQEALHSIDEALGLAENIVNPNDQLEFLHEKAALYRIIHEKEKALAILKDGLVQVRVLKDSRLESMYLNALGIMYATSEYTKALEYYRDALLIRKKRKDTLGIAVVLSNVSAACYRLGRLDKAIEYAKKSLHLSSEIEDKLGIALNFANLGEIYLAQHDQDQASDSFLKAFKAAGELSWKEGITISKIHLALIAIFKNENLSHAKQFLEESIEAALGLNNHELIAKAYLVHSKLLSLQKDEETSQYFFAEAQNIIKKNNLFSIIEQFNKILS